MDDHQVRILVVCTRNACRSPMIERILLAALNSHWPDDQGVQVHSAGTHAAIGSSMHPLARAVLDDRGLSADFHSQPLSEKMIRQADLILTGDRGHRASVVTAVPSAVRRTYCLLQLARLADATPRQPVADAVSAIRHLLASTPYALAHARPGPPTADDLADPIGKRKRAYQQCAQQIDNAVERILAPIIPS